ncbi:MAG: YfhO family protein [bacterium]
MNRLENVLAIFILLLLLSIFFWKAITLQGLWVTGEFSLSDITELNFPLKYLLYDSLQKFSLPLWTKDLLCGYPAFAEGEGGHLYPLNLLLFSFLPPLAAFNYSLIISYLLAGFFTYLFARKIKLSWYSSLISGIIFMFSGFLVTHLKHPSMISACSLMPLLFYLVECYWGQIGLTPLILAGVIFGLQILAGHQQITVYSMVGVSLYFLFRFLITLFIENYSQPKKRRKTKKLNKLRKPFKDTSLKLAFFTLIIIIGLGIGAVQILPTYELSNHSYRSAEIGFENIVRFPYPPKHLITFIKPYFYGDPGEGTYSIPGEEWGFFWENTGYVGILPLILSLIGITFIFLRNKKASFSPANILSSNQHIIFFSFLLIFSILLVLGKYGPLFPLLKLPVLSTFRFPARFLMLVDFSLAILTAFGIEVLLNKVKFKKIIKCCILPIIVIDLFIFGLKFNPTISPKLWFEKPESVKFLEKDKSIYRIYSLGAEATWSHVYFSISHGWRKNLLPYLKHREILAVNSNLLHGVSNADAYFPLLPLRPWMFKKFIEQNINFDNRRGIAIIPPHLMKIMSMLNINYILSFYQVENEKLDLVKTIDVGEGLPPLKIYKNHSCLPRAFLVPTTRVVSDANKIIQELTKEDFEPKKEVIVEKEIPHPSSLIPHPSSLVEIVTYQSNKAILNVSSPTDCILFMSDTYYSSWRVFIDGVEGEIFPANLGFRGVALSKGEHEVKFVYKPKAFKIGLIITLITILLLISYSGGVILKLKDKF